MGRRVAPRRGEVWDSDLDPVVGHEQGGRRPVLVVSNNRLNAGPSELCMVLPITSRDRGLPTHLAIEPPHGGLTIRSFALCDQLRTVSSQRLRRRCGTVDPQIVADAIQIVRLLLDFEAE